MVWYIYRSRKGQRLHKPPQIETKQNKGIEYFFSIHLRDCPRTKLLSIPPFFKHFRYIPKVFEKLESGFVGFAANFLSSLAPCARTMVARSRPKNLRSRLAKFQFFKHFRYIHK